MLDLRLFWQKIRIPVLLLLVVILGGSIGYKILYPEESWNRIFLMTAVTLSTVGYGDILNVGQDPIGTWYTILLILVGMGVVLYAVSALTAFFVEGDILELFRQQTIRRKIKRMKDHYIVCGCGQTGVHVIREMHQTGHDLIVIDGDKKVLERLQQDFPDIPALEADAASDEALEEAKVETARGLVATLANDKDNLFLTISARMLNPDMMIVSKAIDMSMTRKLKNAGANYVVSTNFIGGIRIASEILRPHVVSFLDRMLRGKDKSIRVEETEIGEKSSLVGKKLAESRIPQLTGIHIIAYTPDGRDETYVYNPGSELTLEAGGIMLYIANPEQIEKLKDLAKA